MANTTKEPTLGMAAEDIAKAITKLQRGVDQLKRSPLKRETIVLLISHSAKAPQKITARILDALDDLAKDYLKPKKGKP